MDGRIDKDEARGNLLEAKLTDVRKFVWDLEEFLYDEGQDLVKVLRTPLAEWDGFEEGFRAYENGSRYFLRGSRSYETLVENPNLQLVADLIDREVTSMELYVGRPGVYIIGERLHGLGPGATRAQVKT